MEANGVVSRPYWPALDGLRGYAVLLVVAGHAAVILGPTGGQIGVTVFFVLSGFLINTILLAELDNSRTISLRKFYGRRARRLFPALFVYLLGAGLIASRIVPWSRVWAATWPTIGYVTNYAHIAGVPYSYNAHTWSLAIEEHFYLVWPTLLLLLPRFRRVRALLPLCTALVVLRLVAGLIEPIWAYEGSLTNGYAIVLGCLLAAARNENVTLRLNHRWAELAAAVMLVAGQLSLTVFGSRGNGLAVVGVWLGPIAATLAAVAIWDLIWRDEPSVFTSPWIRHVGRISYGWYLWHAPFMFIATFNGSAPERLFWVGVSFVIAELSWRYVEKPFLTRHRAPRPPSTVAV